MYVHMFVNVREYPSVDVVPMRPESELAVECEKLALEYPKQARLLENPRNPNSSTTMTRSALLNVFCSLARMRWLHRAEHLQPDP